MSLYDFGIISERKYYFPRENNKNILDIPVWTKTMFTSVESSFYPNDNPKQTSKPSKVSSLDPELETLSQKVMKETWDNKDDKFWDTY